MQGRPKKEAPRLCHEGWDRPAQPLTLKREVKVKPVRSILRQPTPQHTTCK
jgi:hypothetical protein